MDRNAIHDMTLRARILLTGEARELLEGVYGLHSDGHFEAAEHLPAVQELEEVRKTRERLESFLADEVKAGLTRREAVDKLVKEVAFTHLNRLVAFKMMESRKLVRGTIDRYHDSNDFLFYLAEDEHADDMARYEQGSLPQNALGEGPRDIAYRHFLLWQSAQMAREIKVLFDPDNLPSSLFPRPRALRELIEMLNAPKLQDAWAPGEEETIGWIYQYFNEPDVEIFKGKAAMKVPPSLIAPKTQLFTPRWIVKLLVHNTLGRLWMQMHPDSRLIEKLDYLVPADDIPSTEQKLARDITLLDPACGTMHFGLVAFDLFVDMYKEEISKAGEHGWPVKPSVEQESDIPSSILANNIYGIDIDLRAVHLSALTLFLRAKTYNPSVRIRESNLANADVLLLNGARLESFLEDMAFTQPVYSRVIKALWSHLKDAGQLGTLLRLDKQIELLVSEEKTAHEANLTLFSDKSAFADAYSQGYEFWEILDQRIIQAFYEFARQHAQQGADSGLFTGEAIKGFKLLDVMMRRYDVVVTNPPYMDSRDYNDRLKKFIEKTYPASKRNLYSAFTERCLEFLGENGRLGIITGQSFMFLSSFIKFRQNTLDAHVIECLTQFDYGLFADARVDTTAFVLRREVDANIRSESVSTFFRVVKGDTSESKRLAFENALQSLRQNEEHPCVYRYRQSYFDTIPGSPWVYWMTPGLRRLFQTLPKLKEIAPPRQGLATADNTRFLRYWWEVGSNNLCIGCESRSSASDSDSKWFPYMKGGSFRRWYGNQSYTVNWSNDGAEICTIGIESGRLASRPQNTEFYFHRGVTWSDLTSGRFAARLSPGGFIFDVKGSSAFPEDVPLVLGLLNSDFAHFALSMINPTVSFQVGDLARLPVPKQSSDTIHGLVDDAVEIAKCDSKDSETTYDFVSPPWNGSIDLTLQTLNERKERLAEVERLINEEVYRLYGISEEDRAAIEAELAEPSMAANGEEETEAVEVEEESTEEAPKGADQLALRWISYAVGIVLGRFKPGMDYSIGCGRFTDTAAEALRALADSDGIAVLDEGHPDDLVTKVERALEIALGEAGAAEVITAALGTSADTTSLLRRYLERDFFKQHIQLYRKRPVYWLLQSPKKSYSVYVFHERITSDTLPLILGNRYLGGKINQIKQRIDDLSSEARSAEGSAKRKLEKALESLEGILLDLGAFDEAIHRVLEMKNDSGQTVGWQLAIDDGVILNMAPIHELIPSWSVEPRKFWAQLEAGDYDWAHTAMCYWPKRVLSKCKSNKSFAIAHDRLDLYEEAG